MTLVFGSRRLRPFPGWRGLDHLDSIFGIDTGRQLAEFRSANACALKVCEFLVHLTMVACRRHYRGARRPDALGVEPPPYAGHADPLDARLAHADETWAALTDKYSLAPLRAADLASWWHADADLGRPVEAFADMSESRALGFLDYQDSTRSFLDLFVTLRKQRIIPEIP